MTRCASSAGVNLRDEPARRVITSRFSVMIRPFTPAFVQGCRSHCLACHPPALVQPISWMTVSVVASSPARNKTCPRAGQKGCGRGPSARVCTFLLSERGTSCAFSHLEGAGGFWFQSMSSSSERTSNSDRKLHSASDSCGGSGGHVGEPLPGSNLQRLGVLDLAPSRMRCAAHQDLSRGISSTYF